MAYVIIFISPPIMSDFVSEFIAVTGSSKSIAEQYLARNKNHLDNALDDFYTNESGRSASNTSLPQEASAKPKSMFGSFADLARADEDDEKNKAQNFFTGGEKSGLAVEDPNNKNRNKNQSSGRSLVDDLLRKAQEEAGQPDWREEERQKKDTKKPKMNYFKGKGRALGTADDDDSGAYESADDNGPDYLANGVPQYTNQAGDLPEKVTRTITFWKEGFSVDDGELYQYDDPKNQEYLKQLNSGRAPMALLNVKMFQDVDVNVHKKLDDSYYAHQAKKPRVYGFGGQGNRLGSHVPGDIVVQEQEQQPKQASPVQDKTESGVVEEEDKGDTTIQIRLANGEILVKKFNSEDNVQVIYDYVTQAGGNNFKPWSLAVSFPMTMLDSKKDVSIAQAGLKNSVVIQRWK